VVEIITRYVTSINQIRRGLMSQYCNYNASSPDAFTKYGAHAFCRWNGLP